MIIEAILKESTFLSLKKGCGGGGGGGVWGGVLGGGVWRGGCWGLEGGLWERGKRLSTIERKKSVPLFVGEKEASAST